MYSLQQVFENPNLIYAPPTDAASSNALSSNVPSNIVAARDTHSFDNNISKNICDIPKFSEVIKNDISDKLHSIFRNPAAKAMVLSIKNDNRLDASNNNLIPNDLLAAIVSYKMPPLMYLILEEQLADAQQLGPCLQGRTVRLIQIYTILKDLPL